MGKVTEILAYCAHFCTATNGDKLSDQLHGRRPQGGGPCAWVLPQGDGTRPPVAPPRTTLPSPATGDGGATVHDAFQVLPQFGLGGDTMPDIERLPGGI